MHHISTSYGVVNHPKVIELNTWRCECLVNLAQELMNGREWIKDVDGKLHFITPDVNAMPLKKECEIIIAQIPTALPEAIRQETVRALRNIYSERE